MCFRKIICQTESEVENCIHHIFVKPIISSHNICYYKSNSIYLCLPNLTRQSYKVFIYLNIGWKALHWFSCMSEYLTHSVPILWHCLMLMLTSEATKYIRSSFWEEHTVITNGLGSLQWTNNQFFLYWRWVLSLMFGGFPEASSTWPLHQDKWICT